MSLQSLQLDGFPYVVRPSLSLPFKFRRIRWRVSSIVAIRLHRPVFILGFLLLCFAVLSCGYIFISISMMERGYEISSLHNEINVAQRESQELQIELSERRGLPHLLENSASLLYTEVENVEYVERSGVYFSDTV